MQERSAAAFLRRQSRRARRQHVSPHVAALGGDLSSIVQHLKAPQKELGAPGSSWPSGVLLGAPRSSWPLPGAPGPSGSSVALPGSSWVLLAETWGPVRVLLGAMITRGAHGGARRSLASHAVIMRRPREEPGKARRPTGDLRTESGGPRRSPGSSRRSLATHAMITGEARGGARGNLRTDRGDPTGISLAILRPPWPPGLPWLLPRPPWLLLASPSGGPPGLPWLFLPPTPPPSGSSCLCLAPPSSRG